MYLLLIQVSGYMFLIAATLTSFRRWRSRISPRHFRLFRRLSESLPSYESRKPALDVFLTRNDYKPVYGHAASDSR